MNLQSDIKIIEFQPQYKDQVILLIDSILKELEVIPNTSEVIDDGDLSKIPTIYSGKGKFWVAIQGDEVMGTVAIRDIGNDRAKLNRMFVLANYRGTGLGQKLLDTALSHAKKENFREVLLNTHHLMTRAHRFYEKNGFKKISDGEDKYTYLLEL